MPIVILKGNQQRMFDIGGSMIPGGKPTVFSEAQVKKHKDVIERILDDEVKKQEGGEEPQELTKETLESKSFKELKEIGKEFGLTDRSKKKLIKEILSAQKSEVER